MPSADTPGGCSVGSVGGSPGVDPALLQLFDVGGLGTKSRDIRRHDCVLTVNTPIDNPRTLRCYISQSAYLNWPPCTHNPIIGTNVVGSSRPINPYQTQDAKRIQSR